MDLGCSPVGSVDLLVVPCVGDPGVIEASWLKETAEVINIGTTFSEEHDHLLSDFEGDLSVLVKRFSPFGCLLLIATVGVGDGVGLCLCRSCCTCFTCCGSIGETVVVGISCRNRLSVVVTKLVSVSKWSVLSYNDISVSLSLSCRWCRCRCRCRFVPVPVYLSFVGVGADAGSCQCWCRCRCCQCRSISLLSLVGVEVVGVSAGNVSTLVLIVRTNGRKRNTSLQKEIRYQIANWCRKRI